MVEAARTPEDTLQIRYIVTGALDRICLAGPAPSVRRDGLWRTTCFEVFILAEFEGLSCDEIAVIVGTRAETVWSRLHYARTEFSARVDKRMRGEQ